jgi:hypothetical protein
MLKTKPFSKAEKNAAKLQEIPNTSQKLGDLLILITSLCHEKGHK